MKLRAVLVEDEEHSLARLKRILQAFPDDIEVVDEAKDGPSAVTALRATAPDIVFLDIELPGFNAFRVLAELERQPLVIFTTAYNHHALDAFKAHAIDYLLKPIDAEAVGNALQKARKMGVVPPGKNLQEILQQLYRPTYPTRLSCKEGDRVVLVKTGEILYFQADHGYTSVHTVNREVLIDTPLVDLERKLDPKDFIRIHRATLVNIAWIAEIRRAYDGKVTVLLKDTKGQELPVSRFYQDNLRNI